MKRLLVICLFQLVTVPFLSSQSNPAKQIGGWVITPPHLTYPVNNTATAALASSTNPSVSLVLEARFQPAGNRPQDAGKGTALLSVAIVSDKDHFQADPLLALKGVPVTMSFDGGKPIALRWDGGDAFINLDLKPGSLVLQFLAKLEGSKTLTISYPISDCPMKTIDLYGSPMQVQDCPVRIVDIGGSKVPVRGCVHCPQKSATFELIGTEAALSSICPADGCQMLK